MKGKFVLIYYLLFHLLNVAAQKKTIIEPKFSPLLGKWKFIESSGGFTGIGAGWSVDNNIIIEFRKNGVFLHYEKGRIRQKDRYRINERRSRLTEELIHVIDFDVNMDQIFEVKRDTLFLQDDVQDGFNFVFIKH